MSTADSAVKPSSEALVLEAAQRMFTEMQEGLANLRKTWADNSVRITGHLQSFPGRINRWSAQFFEGTTKRQSANMLCFDEDHIPDVQYLAVKALQERFAGYTMSPTPGGTLYAPNVYVCGDIQKILPSVAALSHIYVIRNFSYNYREGSAAYIVVDLWEVPYI